MKKIITGLVVLLALTQCKQAPKSEPETETKPLVSREQAQKIAMETQAALGGTLQQKMAELGAEGAIDFCNVKALPITDSVAVSHGVAIRRVTDLPRNPVNRASEAEIALMDQLRQNTPGEETVPMEAREKGQVHYYFPIRTAELCMKCHGAPGQDIEEPVLELLARRYPEDIAVGYEPGQLRGLWKVSVTSDK